MQLSAIQQECLRTMESLSFVILSTIDNNDFPSTRAMLNLRNKQEYPHLIPLYKSEENPLTVYLTTNTSSEKIQHIQNNGNACLYFCEPHRFHGILLQGHVEIVTDKDFRKKAWKDGWEMYYPKGYDDYSVLRFVPENIKVYRNLSVVSENIQTS